MENHLYSETIEPNSFKEEIKNVKLLTDDARRSTKTDRNRSAK